MARSELALSLSQRKGLNFGFAVVTSAASSSVAVVTAGATCGAWFSQDPTACGALLRAGIVGEDVGGDKIELSELNHAGDAEARERENDDKVGDLIVPSTAGDRETELDDASIAGKPRRDAELTNPELSFSADNLLGESNSSSSSSPSSSHRRLPRRNRSGGSGGRGRSSGDPSFRYGEDTESTRSELPKAPTGTVRPSEASASGGKRRRLSDLESSGGVSRPRRRRMTAVAAAAATRRRRRRRAGMRRRRWGEGWWWWGSWSETSAGKVGREGGVVRESRGKKGEDFGLEWRGGRGSSVGSGGRKNGWWSRRPWPGPPPEVVAAKKKKRRKMVQLNPSCIVTMSSMKKKKAV